MITNIAHNAMKVTDMDKALDFYCNKVGFKKAFEIHDDNDKPWIVYLKVCDNSFIELFFGGKDLPSQSDTAAGFMHVCLECDDIVATVEELKGRGVKIDIEVNQGKDFNYQAWIHDPDGNKIELMQIDPKSPQANT